MRDEPCGVVAVDKPAGVTSHDVVARVRRLLGTRRVGHAGTLDPMATGVLVLLVGEATKLGPYLTLDRKRYLARVAFGRATDTLDADGGTLVTAEVPAWLRAEIQASGGTAEGLLGEALDAERARTEQVPPAHSAIHVEGKRSYELARAGEAVELAPRPVEVFALRLACGVAPDPSELPSVEIELDVSKGYYVRSLARDLGGRLGVPAHLSALRRVASGAFTSERLVRLDGGAGALRAAMIPLADAALRSLPCGRLTEDGALRVRRGQRVDEHAFVELPASGGPSAWLDAQGGLVAVGERGEGSAFTIHRGFG